MASPRSKSSSSSSSAERRPSRGGHSPTRSVGTHHHESPQLGLGGALPSTQSPPVLNPSLMKLVSSSSSSSAPATSGVHSTTTTPAKAVQSWLVVSGRRSGGSGSGGRSRKRGRGGNDGSSGSGGDKRGKGELDAPKESDPNCGICGKRFHSWKAYFGHLRAHPEREWRGAFPPPTTGTGVVPMDPESRRLLELNLAPTLLGIATEINTATRPDTNIAPTGPRRVLFDLNRSPPPEEEEEEEDKKEEAVDDKGKGYI